MKQPALPKVSVLIPAYNEEKYICHVLTALLGQDYPHIEIIVANNASTDRTAALVEAFIAEHANVPIPIQLVHEFNQGTNHARECAFKHATGSIIAQIDADCIPAPNWISKGLRYLIRSRRVAITGPYDYYDGNFFMRYATMITQCLTYPMTNELVQATQRGAILIGGNAFIRAGALRMAGGYNTNLTFYGDDVDLGARLSQLGHVLYAPQLVMRTSSRRYHAMGFWQVNKKYQDCFWKLVFRQDHLKETVEMNHPR